MGYLELLASFDLLWPRYLIVETEGNVQNQSRLEEVGTDYVDDSHQDNIFCEICKMFENSGWVKPNKELNVKPESNHLREDYETKPINETKIQEKDQGDKIGNDLNDEAPRNDEEINRNRDDDVRVRPESNHLREDYETKPINETKIQEKYQGDEIGDDLNDEAPRNNEEINRNKYDDVRVRPESN